MRATGRRDTACEMRLRKELFGLGLRYRVDFAPIAGMRQRADVVFGKAKIAVFVDGCFWHMCPLHASSPKANSAWWREKLEANVARDERNRSALIAAGWRVIRVWEHELRNDGAIRIAKEIEQALR